MTNLKNRVDQIYKTFQPMGAVQSGLVSRHDQSFKKKVAEQIQDLDEDSQRRLMAEFFGWGPYKS